MTEQRRLAAILVADVAGFSKLIGSDEAGTLAQLEALHREGRRVWGSLGHIIVRPRPADFILPSRSIPWCSISCPRCVPTWEISQAAKHLPPWNSIWTGPDVRLVCAACRSVLTTSWSGLDSIPHTDGYRPDAT